MGRMFPFCSHQEAGSRFASLPVVNDGARGRNCSLRGHYLGGEVTVISVLQIAREVLMIATMGVI